MSMAGLDRPRSLSVVLRRALWIVFSVIVAVLVILTGASVANFTSVVLAKATVYVVLQYMITYEGLAPDGRLASDGSVNVEVTALVENPSQRSIHFYLVAYSGWIRDGPAEAGLNESRRLSDNLLRGPEGSMWFFRVFGQSAEVGLDPVPARANRTFTFTFTTSAASDPVRFNAIRNITDFAVARGGTAASVPWNQYLFLVFTIDGVPEASSPTAPSYLRDIRRIERELGVNIAR